MQIREASREDFHQFWPVFRQVIEAQETYAYPADLSEDQAFHLWCELPQKTYVAEEDGQILGSYYLKANAMGPGDHVCNCGYMVAPSARGKGIAQLMCEHSQLIAKEIGFYAMQFNSVVSTNTTAVALWQRLGFDIIGTIPEAYRHPAHGRVDTFVMYKKL
ncbi:GNAT family N-acetyltransferase [Pokkaliibacter sp. CJK22405]|uniref:GNAT family N-acetyltransferase n=1 Tax=Pokkaliibacter sp. CJK22405 TaxID=3384615 RepID=UPI0039855168